jgi:hypothetical protein
MERTQSFRVNSVQQHPFPSLCGVTQSLFVSSVLLPLCFWLHYCVYVLCSDRLVLQLQASPSQIKGADDINTTFFH